MMQRKNTETKKMNKFRKIYFIVSCNISEILEYIGENNKRMCYNICAKGEHIK